MKKYDRQNFLGLKSEDILNSTVIGVVGLGGGGSHIIQQAAHIGVGNYILIDPDEIEDSNLNRLIGGTLQDVKKIRSKVEIAERIILGLKPNAKIIKRKCKWQEVSDVLKKCDLIFGCLDSTQAKDALESFARRYLIPYIDIGMDVHKVNSGFLISGQVFLSTPQKPCLRCVGIVTEKALEEEDRNYGAAGGKPQVVWPNGVLASTAMGLAMQLLTPWHQQPVESAYLEYDGNKGTLKINERYKILNNRQCPHYPLAETGDPNFDMRETFKNLPGTNLKNSKFSWKILFKEIIKNFYKK